MKNRRIHRAIAAFLCAVMVLAECPVLVQTAQAADDVESGIFQTGHENAGLSATWMGAGCWPEERVGAIKGWVVAGESASLTFRNTGSTLKTLVLSYNGTVRGGDNATSTVIIGEDSVITATGKEEQTIAPTSYTLTLQSESSVTVTLNAGSDTSSEIELTITVVSFAGNEEKTVSFGQAENGTYRVGATGEYLAKCDQTIQAKPSEPITVSAKPSDDYRFLCWKTAEGVVLSAKADAELYVSESCTITPMFVKNDSIVFQIGERAAFTDLQEAITEAKQGETIVLANSGSLEADKTYTIPDGVTLLVPYADEVMTQEKYSYMEKSPVESSGQDPWTTNARNYTKAPYANRGRTDPVSQSDSYVLSPVMDPDANLYRTLTIPATTTVKIAAGGVFSVGGVMSGGGHGKIAAAGGIIGQHSNIQLNGNIVVAGVFSCNGFVLGSGSITTEIGGAIYEPFVVMDFHAGSWTAAADDRKIPIFLRYTMPNIQTKMTISSGAKLYGYCDLVAGSKHNTTTGMIIGGRTEKAVIQLADGGSVVMTYDADKTVTYSPSANREGGVETAFASVGKGRLTISGGASYGALELQITDDGTSTSSANFPLSLPYNVDITLESGQYAIDKHFYIMPGANLTVGNSATLTLGAKKVYTNSGTDKFVGRARFAVLDGLLEHTSHADAKADIKQGTIQAMAYPTPAELQASKFNPNGGLFVNAGGRLVLGEYVAFGGIIQANGDGAEVKANTGAMLECWADIGLSVDSKLPDAKYRGQTRHKLTAQLVGSSSLIDVAHAKSYTVSSTGEFTKGSFTYYLYGNEANAYTSTECTTNYTSPITLKGGFAAATESEYDATVIVNDEKTQYKVFTEAWNAAVKAGNATVQLERNVTYAGTTLTLDNGKTLTLDLNGYDLISTDADTTIENNGVLTIKGGVLSSAKAADQNPIKLIHNKGTLTLSATLKLISTDGSNANAAYYCLYNDANACLNLDGADVRANIGGNTNSTGYALYNAQDATIDTLGNNQFEGKNYAVYNAGSITTISDGAYSVTSAKDGNAAVYNAGTITTISGGTFQLAETALSAEVFGLRNAGTITAISGGTFKAEIDKDNSCYFGGLRNDSGKTIGEISGGEFAVTNGGMAVWNLGTITKISGGQVTAASAKAAFRNGSIEGKVNASIGEITGGTFTSQTQVALMNMGSATITTISGGTFKTDGNALATSLENGGTIQTLSGGEITAVKGTALKNSGTITKMTDIALSSTEGIALNNCAGAKVEEATSVSFSSQKGTALQNGGAITLNACSITSGAEGQSGGSNALLNSGTGTINALTNCTITAYSASATTAVGHAIFNNGGTITTISGGTITAHGKNAAALYNAVRSTVVTITGKADFTSNGDTDGYISASALFNLGSITTITGGCKFTAMGSGTKAPEGGNYNVCCALLNGIGGKVETITGECTFDAEGAFAYAVLNYHTSNAAQTEIKTIESGTFRSKQCHAVYNFGATIGEIKDGTFTAKAADTYALYNYSVSFINTDGRTNYAGAEITTISGGTFTSGSSIALVNHKDAGGSGTKSTQNPAHIGEISGGTFNGGSGALKNANDCTLSGSAAKIDRISGGTFTATLTGGIALENYMCYANASTVSGRAAKIGEISGGSFTAPACAIKTQSGSSGEILSDDTADIGKISGGTFAATANGSNACFIGASAIDEISGGTFKGTMRALYLCSKKSKISLISGGSFTAGSTCVHLNNHSSEITAVTGGVFVTTGSNASAFAAPSVTNPTAISGGVFKSMKGISVKGANVTLSGGFFKGSGGSGIDSTVQYAPQYAPGYKLSAATTTADLGNNVTEDGFYQVVPKGDTLYTITVSSCTTKSHSTSVADVSLDGTGRYKASETVTFIAPKINGMDFLGWYANGYSAEANPVSKDYVSKMTASAIAAAAGVGESDGAIALVAVYEGNNGTTVTLTVRKNIRLATVTIEWELGDKTNSYTDAEVESKNKQFDITMNSIPVGSTVTITINKLAFCQLADNDQIMLPTTRDSTSSTTTFTIVGDMNLKFASVGAAYVCFVSDSGRFLSQASINAKNEAIALSSLPAAPYKVGYTFSGWHIQGADGTANDLETVKQNILAYWKKNPNATDSIYVEPIYTKVATPCTVNAYTVVDGKQGEPISGTSANSTYVLGEIATFTAPNVDGKAFRFWASDINGANILSFSRTYSFRVTKSTEICAIYGGENNPTAQPVVRVDDVLAKNESGVKSLTFMIGANIPEGYQLVEMGALYAKGSGTDEQLRVEKVGSTDGVYKAVSRLKHVTSLTDYSYALGFNMTGKTDTIYLRGYVAVKKTGDESNTIYYYYSGVTSKNYSAANS